MSIQRVWIGSAAIVLAASLARAGGPELVSVEKIWDRGSHNAFTDLARWRGHWYCTFRESEAHVGGDGRLRVLESADGKTWKPVALIAEEGIDLRDPKLSVTPDDRLMIVAGGSVYRGTKTLQGRRPRVMFSKDGREWTPPRPVLDEGEWLWRVTWHDGRAYGISYNLDGQRKAAEKEADWTLKLFVSDDGLAYKLVTRLNVPDHPNESTVRFLPDGEMVALVRREAGNRFGWIGRSRPPYTMWRWTETTHRLGGPNFLRLPDGSLWAASRSHEGGAKTILARMSTDRYEPALELPSGGDTSYPGLVWHGGMLWMSYYSSHEGKSSIYLAKIKVPIRPEARGSRLEPSDEFHLNRPVESARLQVQRSEPTEIIADARALASRMETELKVTKPDYVVFVPQVKNGAVSDTGNEHFLVFDGPDGSLMAVWTQSSAEAQPDQHIAFSRSTDEGTTWSRPKIIAGPKRAGDGHMASWAYPLVSRSGRIYVLYSQHIGRFDSFFHHTGWLYGVYSDDGGRAWSDPQKVPVKRSINDNPDRSMPPNMLCWQKPLRLGEGGRYLAGFTRWTSFAVRKNPTRDWRSADARTEFMRFENVDDDPEPKDLSIRWFAADDSALAVPFPGHPEISACQEPSIVKLPDGRLFCVMRTAAGSPFWSVSADGGETWAAPRRLLRKDGGEPLLHPLSPCPIYDVGGNTAGSGRYALFIHNHDGHYKTYGPADTSHHRRPVYLVSGRYQAGADQPVWFAEPKFFMDHDGVSLGKPGTRGRLDLALYGSFTVHNGRAVLWYPDRKFFLLGRIIEGE